MTRMKFRRYPYPRGSLVCLTGPMVVMVMVMVVMMGMMTMMIVPMRDAQEHGFDQPDRVEEEDHQHRHQHQ
jgi:hypothetical protein